jgi:hypothetical protein
MASEDEVWRAARVANPEGRDVGRRSKALGRGGGPGGSDGLDEDPEALPKILGCINEGVTTLSACVQWR